MRPVDFRKVLETRPSLTMVGFTINGQPRPHKFLNLRRQVVGVRSKDFQIAEPGKEPSYMSLPKAGEVSATPDGFTITQSDGPGYVVALTYRVDA
jgi:hypothetical protein